VPDHLIADLWHARRTGPTVELWVSGDEAAARLAEIAPPEDLEAWSSNPANVPRGGATALRFAREARRAPGTAPGELLREVRRDLDGDGTAELLLSNVDGAALQPLLELPVDRWREQGVGLATPAARAGADFAPAARTPHLAARGTLVAGEPVLLLLTGAAPYRPVRLVVGTREIGARVNAGVLVPAPEIVVAGLSAGASGAMALAVPWPAGLAPGSTVVLQCWIEEPSVRRGFSASNAVIGTTPGG
jgi:hypothetical protein